jgi:cyclophilin family peptidyl-prolyl cis-trans isomerase
VAIEMNRTVVFCFCFLILACSPSPIPTSLLKKTAPETFKARFITTYGDFEIEATRSWSPLAVDRLYHLIKSGYYTDMAIYRVVPNYVAQFGISNDSILNNAWTAIPVKDEPVKSSNTRGSIAFARGGPNSRSHQIFINLKDNFHLDTLTYMGTSGFPVVAKVIAGMEIVDEFFDEYGNEPAQKQDSISMFGNTFLQSRYPELDYVETAYIIR